MNIRTAASLIATAAIGLATVMTAPAQAAEAAQLEASLSPIIVSALDTMPGGTVVSENEVVWPDGTRLVLEAAAASGSCTSGKYCAHSSTGGTGSRVEYSTCPATNSSLPFTAKSISNKRSTGTVTARRGTTVIATATPGQVKNALNVNTVACAT